MDNDISPELQQVLAERMQLLTKKYSVGLTPVDQQRLDILNKIVSEAFPRVTPEMITAHDQLIKAYTQRCRRYALAIAGDFDDARIETVDTTKNG